MTSLKTEKVEKTEKTEKAEKTATITFGDMAENHVGMEQIGTRVAAGQGFTLHDFRAIMERCKTAGIAVKCYVLHNTQNNHQEPAYVLVLKNGVSALLGSCESSSSASLLEEHSKLEVDKKAYMYGRVVSKKARWNLCFDAVGHEPDYEQGKGRVVAYDDVPLTKRLKESFSDWFGEKARDLKGEGNYYYDVTKCGIGFHGDTERRKVVAVRLGASMPLHFQWFHESFPVGRRIILPLDDGDIYLMSEKAVGTDWKMRTVPTLRHATGCSTYTKL